mgnify:CR=1 FL=1
MIKSKKLSKFKSIEHAFFNRKGGKSTGIFKSLNCGPGSSDVKKNVINNLKVVSNKIKNKSQKRVGNKSTNGQHGPSMKIPNKNPLWSCQPFGLNIATTAPLQIHTDFSQLFEETAVPYSVCWRVGDWFRWNFAPLPPARACTITSPVSGGFRNR